MRIQNEPPSTPVYSYHCTNSGNKAAELPSVNQGQDNSQLRCQYSKAMKAGTMLKCDHQTMFNRCVVMRYDSHGISISRAFTSIANTAPGGVEFQTHQVVKMLKSASAT